MSVPSDQDIVARPVTGRETRKAETRIRLYPVNAQFGEVQLPSVTSVIKCTRPIKDYKRFEIAQKKYDEEHGEGAFIRNRDRRAEQGTQLHTLGETYLTPPVHERKSIPLEEIREDLRPFWKGLQPELEMMGEVIRLEGFLYSLEWGYAGRADWFLWDWNKRNKDLVDLKTYDNPKYPTKHRSWCWDHIIQLVAYDLAALERYGEQADRLRLMIAHGHGKTQSFFITDQERTKAEAEWKEKLVEFYQKYDMPLPPAVAPRIKPVEPKPKKAHKQLAIPGT